MLRFQRKVKMRDDSSILGSKSMSTTPVQVPPNASNDIASAEQTASINLEIPRVLWLTKKRLHLPQQAATQVHIPLVHLNGKLLYIPEITLLLVAYRRLSIMAFGGAVLRITQTALRVIQLLCGVVALAIFSYFLAVLSDHKLPIGTWVRAVGGMSGASVLYLLFAALLTLSLGGITFFAFIAVVLNVCFIGCHAAITCFNRGGAGSCTGNVNAVLGSGPSNPKDPGHYQNRFGFDSNQSVTYEPNLCQACRLETAVFAIAIINIFLFTITAVLQVLLVRHHKKEKHYGSWPANNYTSGTPFWRRNKRVRNTRDAEMATAGTGAIRPSHDTGYTGTTMNGPNAQAEPKYGQDGHGDTFAHNTTTTTTGRYTTTAHTGYGHDHHVTGTNYQVQHHDGY
jgi:hypothetical protein